MIRDAGGLPPPPATQPPRREGRPPPEPRATPPPAPQPASTFNPRLRLDPALNLVVIEFRAADGEVLRSFPTPRELRAYRHGLEQPPRLDLKG